MQTNLEECYENSWQVIVCRPQEKALELAQLLEKNSIKAIVAPLISIEIGSEIIQLPAKLSSLAQGDLVFLLSPNVFLYKEYLNKVEIDSIKHAFRHDLHYFAIGKSTADTFYDFIGLEAHYPKNAEISENLIKLESLNHILSLPKSCEHRQALLLRGNGGRNVIANFLQSNDYSTSEIELYKRKENLAGVAVLKKALTADKKNIIIITSGEILSCLIKNLSHEDLSFKMRLLESHLLVVSDRIKQIAISFGFKHITVANKASNFELKRSVLQIINYASD